MTTLANINPQTAIGAKAAPNMAAGAMKNGINGGNGQTADFISLIMARLQESGMPPVSAAPPSPLNTADSLKARLSAILADLGQTQAPAGTAGPAQLFQNGTATSLPTPPQGLPETTAQNGAAAPDAGAANISDTSIQVAGAQPAVLNNEILAQQLGLDPAVANDADIISALQSVFADLGIDLNLTQSGEQTSPIVIGPDGLAQETPAHLTSPPSMQVQAQNASPAQSSNTAPDTSPSLAQALAAPPPADQAGAIGTVAGEVVTPAQTQEQGQDSIQATAAAPLILDSGVSQSFMTVEAAMQNAARSASAQNEHSAAPAGQKPARGQTAQTSGTAPHVSNASPSSPTLTAEAVQQATQPSATNLNTVGSNGSAVPGTDILSGQDFLNGFGQQSFDSQLAQSLRGDHMPMMDKANMAGAHNMANYRPGAQAAPVIRAVMISMTRGADNAINNLSLQLEPAELGRVQVDLKMTDDGVLKAHILTDKADTLTLLQKDSSALQRAFEQAGLDVGSENFSFDLRQDSGSQFAQDKDAREMLFDMTGMIDGEAGINGNADLMNAAMYGQQYIRPNGVNVYV